MLKYKDPELGRFEKLDIRAGVISTVLVSERELAELASYLNKPGAPGAKRILAILTAMQELETVDSPLFSERIEGPLMVMRRGRFQRNPAFKKVAPEKYQKQQRIGAIQDSINRKLARYRFWPCVRPPRKRRWTVILIQRRHGTNYEFGEAQVLETILNLARAACLNRLRRCVHCQRWLYAKFRHQSFCSTKCQQKQYTQTEEFKAKRRDYMRRYYQKNYQGNSR